jgi:D-glycero-D-manno-heptose 1,7-bisphosphate phosphatase
MNSPHQKRRAVFWDRDGTLMHDGGYCSQPGDVRAIAGAGEALGALRARGWLHVLITNQSGIARGLLSTADFHAVNDELFRQLGLVPEGVYFCPDHPSNPSGRRKPGTGMVAEACAELGIDPAASWFVGDKESDVQCGLASGCRTILVRTGYGGGSPTHGAHAVCRDATAAAAHILQQSADPENSGRTRGQGEQAG